VGGRIKRPRIITTLWPSPGEEGEGLLHKTKGKRSGNVHQKKKKAEPDVPEGEEFIVPPFLKVESKDNSIA